MAIATINPTTGRIEERFEPHSAVEVEARIARAAAVAARLRLTDFPTRAGWMRAAADILELEADRVAAILTTEMGKSLVSARAEALKCVKNMRFYADHAQEFLAEERLENPSSVGASSAVTRYEPLGVVLAVMPWNYPLWQVIRFAAPALMAANVGVLKHASNVPRAALYLDTLFTRGGFPEGAFSTLLIGSADVASVLADPRIKAVTLTGSEPAGRSVASIAGANIKKAVLELGGSDPFIVMPSADIEAAATKAVSSRTGNNGQSCIAAKRFIVHEAIYAEFTERFVEKMRALRVGDPMLEDTDVGPIATESGRRDLAELVDDALARGAIALVGGKTPDGDGWFYPPTIIAEVTPNMRLYSEETFGPVASLYRVSNAAEALALANATDFGLSSNVWTTDAAEKHLFTNAIDAGAVFINGMTVSYPELPFGGIKTSGYGRELAAAGIREFCNLKTVWEA